LCFLVAIIRDILRNSTPADIGWRWRLFAVGAGVGWLLLLE
jgi:hypothetical protein